ncbi:hypothetical protein SLOPH_1868, partial [Spraguea lophii 42_110]
NCIKFFSLATEKYEFLNELDLSDNPIHHYFIIISYFTFISINLLSFIFILQIIPQSMKERIKLRNQLKEIFPNISSDIIEQTINENNNIDEMIINLLEPSNVDVTPNEYLYNMKEYIRRGGSKIEKKYNYEEIFGKKHVDYNLDPLKLRKEAFELYEKAQIIISEASNKYSKKSLNPSLTYYTDKAMKLQEKAKSLNHTASTIFLNNMLKRCEEFTLDFHNLHVKESIDFLEDYIEVKNPQKMKIITGQKYNSVRLMPEITKYLNTKKYKTKENGPAIIAIKKL